MVVLLVAPADLRDEGTIQEDADATLIRRCTGWPGQISGGFRYSAAAFFTRPRMSASTAGVRSVRAKQVGHMVPSSSVAASSKPKVAYLVLNFSAALK